VSLKTKFIVFDGPDDSGKSTLLRDLARDLWPHAKEIKFPKTLPSGTLLRMNTERDFEILFTMFELLDPAKTYLLDRFVVSNLVYDKILRDENAAVSRYYHQEFKRRFEVLEIFVTRPPVTSNFVDDRISLTAEQFNACIAEYKKYGTNYQILARDANDQASQPLPIRATVYQQCLDFVRFTQRR